LRSAGRDHPHVDLDAALAADPGEALVGEDAQDLGLGGQRHVGDFIQEKRAAMRLFEEAGRESSPPSSTPNSSSSTRSGVIRAALTTTNGALARGLQS
jgi:hypothetical protein